MQKIKSEKKIDFDTFNLKIGTLNRLNPSTLYFELDFYITPQYKQNNYIEDVYNLKKKIDKIVYEKYKSMNLCKNYISVIDLSESRVKINKKCHFTMQIHFKPTLEENQEFSKIYKTISDNYIDMFNNIKNIVYTEGFLSTKTKK